MHKYANVQEAVKAHFNAVKPYFNPEDWPEDVDIDNLPENFIDLLMAVDKIYEAELGNPKVDVYDKNSSPPPANGYFVYDGNNIKYSHDLNHVVFTSKTVAGAKTVSISGKCGTVGETVPIFYFRDENGDVISDSVIEVSSSTTYDDYSIEVPEGAVSFNFCAQKNTGTPYKAVVYYSDKSSDTSIFANQIPNWDEDAITLPDAFYHLLTVIASRSFNYAS